MLGPQGGENRLEEGSVGNHTYLCHLDRSEAQWRDLRFPTSGRFWIYTSGRFRVRSKGGRPQLWLIA